MRVAVMLLSLCGCTGDEHCEGYVLNAHISSRDTFDRVWTFSFAPTPRPGQVLTPALIAGGAQPAPGTVIPIYTESERSLGHATTSDVEQAADSFDRPDIEAVLAERPSGAGYLYGENPDLPQYSQTCETANKPIMLFEADEVELWAAPGAGADTCARIVFAGVTTYLVRGFFDPDCDGQSGSADCQPYAYCDPTHTSTAGMAACACP